jgi:hypothetical protein
MVDIAHEVEVSGMPGGALSRLHRILHLPAAEGKIRTYVRDRKCSMDETVHFRYISHDFSFHGQ